MTSEYNNFLTYCAFNARHQIDGYYAVPLTFVNFDTQGVPQFELDEDGDEIVPDDLLYLDNDEDVAYRMLALMMYLDDFREVPEDKGNDTFSVGKAEYLVVTDSEADELWDQDLENYIDECILYQLPEAYRHYFDRRSWKKDARVDGRANSLNRYDGDEGYICTQHQDYYIYRQN